jgi:protein TonB
VVFQKITAEIRLTGVNRYILVLCLLVAGILQAQNTEDDIVYGIVEVAPQFPGGTIALNEYLETNLRYPSKARKANISGKVLVRILIEKDGTINESKILLGLEYGCNEEVLRLIAAFPKWVPGSHSGRLLRTYTQFVVHFRQK